MYLWYTECARGGGYVTTAETHRQLPALVLFSHRREGTASSGHRSCRIFCRQPLWQSGTESILRNAFAVPVSFCSSFVILTLFQYHFVENKFLTHLGLLAYYVCLNSDIAYQLPIYRTSYVWRHLYTFLTALLQETKLSTFGG